MKEFNEIFEGILNKFAKKELILIGDINIDAFNSTNNSWFQTMDKGFSLLIDCSTASSEKLVRYLLHVLTTFI
jgi:hypothetical protein